MNNKPHITPLKTKIQTTLPLVYSDEVSFLETLLKFQNKLNEIITLIEVFDTNANNYTDDKILNLKSELLSKIQILHDSFDKLYIDFNNVGLDFDIKLKQLFDRIIAVLEYSQNLQNIDWSAKLKTAYLELLNMLVYGFNVIDPTTGLTSTVQVAINNVYNSLMQRFGISVNEYESLNLTVDVYENMYISVWDYTFRSKDELFLYYFSPYFNPFTGERTPLQTILNILAMYHMDGITVESYNNLDITVDDYNNRTITVDDYKIFIN